MTKTLTLSPPASAATQELLSLIHESLLEKKARDIVCVDVRGRSAVTDFYVIATGTSAPHLKALSQEIQQHMKSSGHHCYRRSDDHEGGWMVLDYIDVVVHLFERESREYYGIEELWEDAPRFSMNED
jgi:ribosome-associated protein